jgi:UDP-N-acetylglucosamine 2-epimerase
LPALMILNDDGHGDTEYLLSVCGLASRHHILLFHMKASLLSHVSFQECYCTVLHLYCSGFQVTFRAML